MANFSVQPEKFDSGDIVSWFRQFECCSTANAWNEEKQLQVLPAFLRGPAAAYFHALPNEVKGSYRNLKEQLLASFALLLIMKEILQHLNITFVGQLRTPLYFCEFEGLTFKNLSFPQRCCMKGPIKQAIYG